MSRGAPDAQSRSWRPLFDPRLTAALVAARAVSFVIQRAGRGGGTAAPGLVADRLDPRLLTKITSTLPGGAVVVAGTNGKTTVSRMVAGILENDGRRVLHNRSGSNLVRGVVATYAGATGLFGRTPADIAVIETDEAAFPEIVKRVQPRVILLNNLFRDQLDRYGEITAIGKLWRAALRTLPPETIIVVNADDPTLVAITDGLPVRRIAFGLEQTSYQLASLPHAADAATCRLCGADLVYDALYVSHLGEWRCPNGDASRPPLNIAGRDVALHGVESLDLMLRDASGDCQRLLLGVPGLYNAYNAVAAAAVARTLGVASDVVATGLAEFRAAFGRVERLSYRDRTLIMALVKNPTGFNEVLRMLTAASGELTVPVLVAINDLAADGRDVSWLWDVDFELLAAGSAPVSTAGIRGADMANRLKYAGLEVDRITPLPRDERRALEAFVDSVPEGETAYLLPTYTAMLEFRRVLSTLGAVESFWRQ